MELLQSCVLLVIVVWLIVRASNQRTSMRPITSTALPPHLQTQNVAAIVPARNEEGNIALCLRGLVAQTYPAECLRIVVVDDHSVDATADIAGAVAKEHSQVILLHSPPLPPRWIGKSHACLVGTCAAAEVDWLCFLDADVRVAPALLTSAVAVAASNRLDLLSLAPRQHLGSFAERLILPCGLYLLAFCQDLQKVQSPPSTEATATGQFMLVRANAYWAVGGHAAVHREICEDLALARLLKRSDYSVLLLDGSALISTRMYSGWRTLWPGIVKNLVEMLGGPLPALLTAFAGVFLAWAIWLIPIADGLSCTRGSASGCWALLPAGVAFLAAAGLHIAGAAYFRIPLWYGLLFPIGYTVGALMTIDSVRWRLRGRVAWKGRNYP